MSKTVSFITENYNKYDPHSIDEYLTINGYSGLRNALNSTPKEVIEIAKASQILGRGGAAYPLGKKWEQAAAVKGDSKVVICNADEGEPSTFKDRSMLEHDPFRIIEGMTIAGYAVGAQSGYIYIREEYRHLQPRMKNAIHQAKVKGYLGDNILGTDFSFDIHVYTGVGAYVCGEGSALIESIEGKSGRPRIKPPYIKESGLHALPTCVNNVESLALGTALLTHGPEKYLSYGTPECPGTKLISIAGNVNKPGVYEIPFGLTLSEIIYNIAGGVKDDKDIRLIQVGGASGKICPPSLIDTPFTYNDLEAVDMMVGSGAVLVIDEDMSLLRFLKITQEFFSHESCGKCTPCREGNRQISHILDRMLAKTHTQADMKILKRFATIMSRASFCGLGETAQNALLNAIKYFPEEFAVKEEPA